MLPNIATPTMNDTKVDTENVGIRKRRTGNIGWGERRSTAMSVTNRARVTAIIPTISRDPQAYWTPPHVVINTIRVTVTVINAAPAQSITGRSWRTPVGSTRATITNASTPIGRFT